MMLKNRNKIWAFCFVAFFILIIYYLFFTPSVDFYTGTILEIKNGFAIILIDSDCPLSHSGKLATIALNDFNDELSEGDWVEIGYDGVVFYSYPLQTSVEYIKKLSP